MGRMSVSGKVIISRKRLCTIVAAASLGLVLAVGPVASAQAAPHGQAAINLNDPSVSAQLRQCAARVGQQAGAEARPYRCAVVTKKRTGSAKNSSMELLRRNSLRAVRPTAAVSPLN